MIYWKDRSFGHLGKRLIHELGRESREGIKGIERLEIRTDLLFKKETMLSLVKKALKLDNKTALGSPRAEPKKELLAAVLLLEAARSDYECSESEMVHVIDTVKSMFNLSHEYVEELLEFAKCEREKAADIYHYTRLANEHMSRDQKLAIMEAVWRIIYADGQIDKYEEHFARKLMNLLWLEHKDFIEAKLKAKPKQDC